MTKNEQAEAKLFNALTKVIKSTVEEILEETDLIPDPDSFRDEIENWADNENWTTRLDLEDMVCQREFEQQTNDLGSRIDDIEELAEAAASDVECAEDEMDALHRRIKALEEARLSHRLGQLWARVKKGASDVRDRILRTKEATPAEAKKADEQGN